MELQASKYAASVHKLLKKYKGVWKQGKELVESVANRKMDNPIEEFDKTLNKKLANLLELAESANSIGLTLKESNSQKWASLPKAFSLMPKSKGLINQDFCEKISEEILAIGKQIIRQSDLWIHLCGKLNYLTERDDLIYMVACWAHQPLIRENSFEMLMAKCLFISTLK
ncbi:Oidioi.mRNA.OKI2018_I69.PAR.g8875.t1.cds [Oikopleura dioica]|uniref:Oidioi.mRNA.OKI2018_I69.PAR.g8875.t1.cds n=1 Tax=Oikopleura dioica TaxID=34765 RepID=A0ABN7RM98_OIKDI|nr:Oidioi.mRNA.OKI2018_I69.PAR.g8875.t1.cds [Oikopleura dioica]